MGGKFERTSDIVMWHNPRCTKSRQTLALLRERGVEPEIREYLKNPPSADELDDVLRRLAIEPRQLMRKKEKPYHDRQLADEALSRDELIAAMVEEPILIERPVVIRGERAALGRPPENVTALFEG